MSLNGVYLIGLTGNIACGKSTMLGMLREHGAQVVDADRTTYELQQPGQPVYLRIVADFGPDILVAPDGPIDRRKLGAIVFSDPAALRRLEQIVHPAVHERILAWLEALGARGQGTGDRGPGDKETRRPGDKELGSEFDSHPFTPSPLHPFTPSPVAVIDAIKLLEAGWKPVCDAIWVVTCAPEQQLERLMTTRGMSAEEARGRIDAQPPQAEKVAQADVVIDNSGPLEATRRQVEAAWRAIPNAGAADQSEVPEGSSQNDSSATPSPSAMRLTNAK